MKRKLMFIVTLLFVVGFSNAFALEENGIIEMPFTEIIPTIDGRWTTENEWKYSSQSVMEKGRNLAYIHSMHDRDNLYIMIDYVTDQNLGSDFLLICFDTDNDGGSTFDADDYCFYVNEKLHMAYMIMDPDGFVTYMDDKSMFRGSTGFSSENSPNESGRKHVIYEMSFSIPFLHKQDSYGIFLEVLNIKSESITNSESPYTGITWPSGLVVFGTGLIENTPSTWGTIISPQNTITAPPIPVILVLPDSLSFENIEVSEKSFAKPVTITNLGTSVLKIDNIRGTSGFSVSGISTPVHVVPGESTEFKVTFAPLYTGEKNGKITIFSNDLEYPTFTINADGIGAKKGTTLTGNGGCLIATATYGTEMSQQVQQLREIRDNSLLQTESGTVFLTAFNQIYYSFSPFIADMERENPIFREMVKIAIIPLLSSLLMMSHAESEQEMIGYGIGIILLNIGMYVGIPVFAVVGLRKIRYND